MAAITEKPTVSIKKKYKKKSQVADIWKRYRRNKLAMLGLFILTVIILMMIFADIIVPYKVALTQDIMNSLKPPSSAHIFGTDEFGRDIFARVVHASRNSLLMGIGAVIVGVIFGCLFAGIAGYYGGKADTVIMRVIDTIMCIPAMVFALAIVAALGAGLINVLIALMFAMVPALTRVIRAAILAIGNQEYIEAAKSYGTPDRFIILKHTLPNVVGVVIVQATMAVGSTIIAAASLSYLGMGIQPPTPEWGAMLSAGKFYMMYAAYMVIFPGLAISLTALSLNLMGDGLRDALDPRLKD